MVQESAGTVSNVTLGGELLLVAPPSLRAKEAIGSFLVDARLESVARVTDVIGPVAAPVVVASPKPGVPAHRLVGRELWLSPPKPRRSRGPPPRGPPRGDSRSQQPRRFRGGR